VERLRIGTMQTASEPRGPPSRQFSGQRRRGDGSAARKPLFRETTGNRRPRAENSFDPVFEGEYPEEVYDLYTSSRSSRNSRGVASRRTRKPQYVEEDLSASDGSDAGSTDNDEFEMLVAPGRGDPRGAARRVEVRKIRVKVHTNNDTRFIMIGPRIAFGDFEGKIREKFGLRLLLKIKMQDDGDMVTMGDQDDLDLLLSSTKQVARKENSDMGKMEVWVEEQL